MHKKRIMIFTMALSMGLFPVNAFAAEQTDPVVSDSMEEASDLSGFDETVTDGLSNSDLSDLSGSAKSEYLDALMSTDSFEKMYQNIQSMVSTTDQSSLSDYYKENYEITFPTGDFFDVSDVDITKGYDNSITNAQYLAMASNFAQSYTGMVDASGQSGNSMQIFQQEYGDIAKNLKLETPTLPKGFDMSSLVSSAASSVSSTYQSALNSSGVAAVRDSIDTQWIFDKALAGPDSYSLKSYKTLQSMNDAASSANKQAQSERFTASKSLNSDAYKKLSGDVLTKSQSDLMKVIDTDSSYLLTTDPDKKQDIAADKLDEATDNSGKLRRKWNWIKDKAGDVTETVADAVDKVNSKVEKTSWWSDFINSGFTKTQDKLKLSPGANNLFGVYRDKLNEKNSGN